MTNKIGLILSGIIGSLTNTIFVFLGIYLLFSGVYTGNVQHLLALVFTNNAIAEMIISGIVILALIPALERIKN